MVKILDCTTRDGGHTTNWTFSDDFVENLIAELNSNGATYYEIGYRNHFDTEGKGKFYKCTPEFLQKYYQIKGNLQLGVMTDTSRYSEKDFPNSKEDFIDFIRIACHPDRIRETLEISKDLHDKGYKVFIQLMEINNVDEAGYLSLFEWEHKEILESLYFADSYGVLHPSEIEHYYNKLAMIGFEKISFHAHNTIAMALPNSLKAIECGVWSVDVTQNGIGRNGGNLDSAELFEHFVH